MPLRPDPSRRAMRHRASARTLLGIVALFALLLLPAAASAQKGGGDGREKPRTGTTRHDRAPVRGEFGFQGLVAVPVGAFGRYVDLGGGLGGHGVLYLDEAGTVGLRLDGSWVLYDRTTVRRRLSPTIPFVDVDVTTQNWIGSMGFGPQFLLGRGRVRPELHGTLGFSYFATTTSVEGTLDSEPFASTTNFDDFTYALTGGGGLRILLSEDRRHPISLDLGAAYVRHGLTEYLREGGLREGPGGTVIVSPIRSETNLLTFHAGLTFGIR